MRDFVIRTFDRYDFKSLSCSTKYLGLYKIQYVDKYRVDGHYPFSNSGMVIYLDLAIKDIFLLFFLISLKICLYLFKL